MPKINTLYLVDDDDIFQFLTRRIIEETRLVGEIKVFSNGLRALEFLKSVQDTPEALPEIILLDLSMPVMDGWDFLEEYIMLRPFLGKKINIYVVSSSITPSDIQRAQSISEVTDYIIKPVTVEKFAEIVRSLVA